MTGRLWSGNDVARYWSKVDAEGDCWEWQGARIPQGYGIYTIAIPGTRAKRSQVAHRASWELLVGPIPDGLTIDHLCRNRGCVNPDHLEPVTHSVNNRRGFSPAFRTLKTGYCNRGHPMDDVTIVHRSSGQVERWCRRCRYLRMGYAEADIPIRKDLRTTCKRGHLMEGDNILRTSNGRARRAKRCRACVNEYNRQRYWRARVVSP